MTSDFDFVMLLEDLPNKNKQILQDLLSSYSNKQKSGREVASEFLGQFNSDYKNGNVENLAFLTDYVFHRLSEEHFREKSWPKLETLDEGLNLHDHVILLYRELYYRHIFSRLQGSVDISVRCEAWSNYVALFKTVVQGTGSELHQCELPCKWVWEILDEAIYQFQNFCLFASKLKKEDPQFQELAERKDIPNFKELKELLRGLVDRSHVLTSEGAFVSVDKPKTSHYFGFYSYLALVKLHVSHGFIEEAYGMIQNISGEYVSRYLKRSWCALISFFYYTGLTYILNNDVLKGTKILEKGCSFFYRYRHFLSKSMQIDKYSRLVERATLLLTIFLSFNKTETEDTIMRVIGEKYHEKHQKLLKYDQTTFEETFTSGCIKIVLPLVSPQDLAAYTSQESVDLVPSLVQKLLGQLNKYRILNGVESVLLIYNRLSVEKLSKILKLDPKEIEVYLTEYENIRQAVPRNTSFEQTFLPSCLAHLRSHSFEVRSGEILVKRAEPVRHDLEGTVEDFIQELTQRTHELRRF